MGSGGGGGGGGGGGVWGAMRTVSRGLTAVATGGMSEIAPRVLGETGGKAANWIANPIPMANDFMTNKVIDVADGATRMPDAAKLPDMPEIAMPEEMDPSVSNIAGSSERKRKLAALRQGLAQTIATSAQGVTGAPLVAQAQAYQTGSKGLLGQ